MALSKEENLNTMLDSLQKNYKLGGHANDALIALNSARIHPYDNIMERYRAEFIDKTCNAKNRWLDTKNTENIARRFSAAMKDRLKMSPAERAKTAVEFYTKWHGEHIQCSQYHCCRVGYCQRVQCVKSDDDSPDKTHIICRHRWPWCRKLCLYCKQAHSFVNSDFCKKCINVNSLPTIPETTPFEIIDPARVEHSTRFDKNGNFRMAPAHVIGPRNNPSINTHNRDQTLLNNGNTDLKHPINPGAVRHYTIGYLCKSHVTLKETEKAVQRVNKSIQMDPNMKDEPAAKAIQRMVSAAVAARTFSTQNACWSIMMLPIIDTNLRFVKVPLNGDLSCLNIDVDEDPDADLTETPLTGSSYVDAYSQRTTKDILSSKNKDGLNHLHNCSLTQFVRSYQYSYKHNTNGESQSLTIYPRTKRFQSYSHFDHSLKFADKRYPLIHVARFYPQRNPDPAHPTYPEWCRFALMQHKPWRHNMLNLWKEHTDVELKTVDDVPAEAFIKAWEMFAETAGLDIALRIKSYRDEVSCESDRNTLGSFIDNSFLENELLASWMSAADMLPCDADSDVREMLKNPPDWSEQREKVTARYRALGDTVLDDALTFVTKNRREGISCPRPVPFVHPRDDLDDDQRLV